MKNLIKAFLNKLGLDVVKLKVEKETSNPFCGFSEVNKNIIDIEALGRMSTSIPGMITPDAGKFLFTLCYMQSITGDVVEVGSWQGRSTTFLARAVEESQNGNFYAIDHFGGNTGKEKFYEVDGSLSNLKENFERNMARFGLDKVVKLLDMTNIEAAEKIKDSTIRFLFIDGDHTKAGVMKDIELFFPRLTKGSIVVFDDYFEGFPGLIAAIDEQLLQKKLYSKIFYYEHTLVVEIKE